MPRVTANNITMNYDQKGAGEPLILIPYLAADNACYAFQVAEYAKHFTCISRRSPRNWRIGQAARSLIRRSCSPTTLPRSCRRRASERLMSPAFPSAGR